MTNKHRKPSLGRKKHARLAYMPGRGQHWVLVNKKTGRISSSNNWLMALAAVAFINGERYGLPAALPQEKASRLLASNKLVLRTKRGVRKKIANADARRVAKNLIPVFAVLWEREKPQHRAPRRQDFCKWIVKSLQTPSSSAFRMAARSHHDFCNKTNWRWWLARLEKMQS